VNSTATGTGNNFYNNTIDATGDYGIYLKGSSNTFRNNTVTTAAMDAVYITTGSSNVFFNNTLIGHTDSGDDGVVVARTSSSNKFGNNYIRGYRGVNSTATGTGNNFYNNTIDATGDYGIYLKGSSNTFRNNTVTTTAMDAVYITTGSSNVFYNNTISASATGVHITTTSNSNNITNNSIGSSGGHGVYLNYSSGNNLSLNHIEAAAGYDGVVITGVAKDNIIKRNDITRGRDGIGVAPYEYEGTWYRPSFTVISYNRIVELTRYGVLINESNHTVYGNTIGDPICGINVSNSRNVTVTNNTVVNNTYGICAHNSWGITVRNNTLANNTYGITLDNTNFSNLYNNSIFDTTLVPDDVYGVWLKGSSSDNKFWDTTISATINDVYLSAEANINNTFLNCSYDSEFVGSNAELVRQWYVWVNVTKSNSGTPLKANVTFENRTGVRWDGNQTTSETTGLTNKSNLTEYKNVSGATLWWTNYTVNVSKRGYTTNSTSFNFTNNKLVNVTLQPTYLYVNITTPPYIPGKGNASQNTGYIVGQNRLFVVNATVECRLSNCGNVQGIARYNASSPNPDSSISDTYGAIPFFIQIGSNLQSCSNNPLNVGETCNLSWIINSTGDLSSHWKLDVLFISQNTVDNDTQDIIIEIAKVLIINLDFNNITFCNEQGSCEPVSTGNNGTLNNQGGYNISVNPNSNEIDGLYIKGTNLTAQSIPNIGSIKYGIGVKNVSWNEGVNSYTDFGTQRLTHEYALIQSSVTSGQNVTMYFWIDLPPGQYAQRYVGTAYVMANASDT
jgi:parallel beta-helix repeat protein